MNAAPNQSDLSAQCPEKALVELLRRSEITGKARYHNARRLSLHAWFSQWTLALLAVGQLVVSLIPALKLQTLYSESYLNFGGIFFGILVLAYSLLLGMANFFARAQKMHECGLEMGRLSRKLTLWACGANATNDQYNNAATQYYDILDKYENHTRLDYLVASFEQSKGTRPKLSECGLSKIYCIECMSLLFSKFVIYFWHCVQFSHYVLSTSMLALWICLGIAKTV
jgi:SMODS and SLOG-associating 2TM effector domain family 5